MKKLLCAGLLAICLAFSAHAAPPVEPVQSGTDSVHLVATPQLVCNDLSGHLSILAPVPADCLVLTEHVSFIDADSRAGYPSGSCEYVATGSPCLSGRNLKRWHPIRFEYGLAFLSGTHPPSFPGRLASNILLAILASNLVHN